MSLVPFSTRCVYWSPGAAPSNLWPMPATEDKLAGDIANRCIICFITPIFSKFSKMIVNDRHTHKMFVRVCDLFCDSHTI